MSRSAATSSTGPTGDAILLSETFSINSIDSQKYDRVSRITGSNPDVKFHLDIAHDLYPMQPGETIELVLASTLKLDGSSDIGEAKQGWRDIDEMPTLADAYEYVCYGKIYRFEEAGVDSIKAYISFGGLLLYLEGSAKKLTTLKHEYVYLLVKKV
ncbi:DNA-directed RNA polymerases I, II, and III subunit RPABC3 [Arthrobotrys conoides]|uniref:DNA-directed RNA polymerases I, II, and III subunit RPABC3 n=1 Tax=Arthrobotrys conoides TaxID=74498 RepID=A0AAN8NEE7_9PEZI